MQYVPPMSFAVSCSIDPGWSRGSMVIRNVGLFNLPPAYQESNYHPQAEYRPYMQYGAWCQLWSTTAAEATSWPLPTPRCSRTSACFSPARRNCSSGMLEWLNHSARAQSSVIFSDLSGVWRRACALACVAVRQRPAAWMLVLAATWAAWSGAAGLVIYTHRAHALA